VTFPSPQAFGLPPQFTSWRPGQVEGIFRATSDSPRFSGLVLPTGAGKSLIYVAAAHLSGKRTVILTSTRALQRQLLTDFGSLEGTMLVQGQRAYPCTALQPGGELVGTFGIPLETVMADTAPCHVGAACSLMDGGCPYYDALRLAQRSSIVITNYAWWFAMLRQPPERRPGRPDLLILDEAHAAPDALADALGATIAKATVLEVLKEGLPAYDSLSPREWIDWAGRRAGRLAVMLDGVRARDHETAKKLRRAQTLLRTCQTISRLDATLLLVSPEHDGVRFDLVWAAPYHEMLFQGVPKVVLTSATLSTMTADLLGIAPNTLDLYESGEGFPVDQRPVYLFNESAFGLIRVDHRMSPDTERRWINRIDQILRKRQDRKGIIHSVSYARRDAIMAKSDYKDRMITHGRHNTAAQIEAFKNAPPGTILVSPAMTTGYDFPYDQCEYQIVTKIPFPDTRPPIIKARTEIDGRYPMYVAMQELVQMVGRGMRAPDDHCETFIVDDHAQWFLSKHAKLAPRWFRRAIERIDRAPEPPPPLGLRVSHNGGMTEENDDE
jgi:ATP-dependent DNA helicase DinG